MLGPLTISFYSWGEEMTEEERTSKIAALLEERRGYELRGLNDRVAAVDAELRRLGAQAVPARKRAAKRKT